MKSALLISIALSAPLLGCRGGESELPPVHFIPNMDTAKERDGGDSCFGNWEFNDQELLEVSQVTIPSNPEGLQQLKSLMEHSGHIDPFLLSFVNDTLKELQPPAPVIDYRELVHSAFTKAYREVTPWYS